MYSFRLVCCFSFFNLSQSAAMSPLLLFSTAIFTSDVLLNLSTAYISPFTSHQPTFHLYSVPFTNARVNQCLYSFIPFTGQQSNNLVFLSFFVRLPTTMISLRSEHPDTSRCNTLTVFTVFFRGGVPRSLYFFPITCIDFGQFIFPVTIRKFNPHKKYIQKALTT